MVIVNHGNYCEILNVQSRVQLAIFHELTFARLPKEDRLHEAASMRVISRIQSAKFQWRVTVALNGEVAATIITLNLTAVITENAFRRNRRAVE